MAAGINSRRPRPTALVVLSLLPLLAACMTQSADPAAPPAQRVELGGRVFHLEIAADGDSRYQGLSDRPSIAEDGGMLFVFPRAAVRTFVMRRCLVPIDIVFLGPNGRIVSMHAMQLEPYDTPESQLKRYSSQWPAQFAIELRGGTLKQLDLQLGQAVDLPIDSLQTIAR